MEAPENRDGLTATVPATLTPGWHRLQIRTYNWGYGATRLKF